MSNQNRYKFTVNTSTGNSSNNHANGINKNGAYNQNVANKTNGTASSASAASAYNKNMYNNNQIDEDFDDISDNDLIKASQEVESQLKFTNNVHHTTSNAINIFSQFSSSNANLMPPPTMSSMGVPTATYSNMGFNPNDSILLGVPDEVKNELNKVKTENKQKEGECRILRDRLKKLEQETQRMRTERCDLIKKLQQQQEEAKKVLQKQIEFKEIENQFKSQEIVELTMKYKVLESSVRNKSTNLNSSTIVTQPQITSTHLPQSQHHQQQLSQHYSVFDELSNMTNTNNNVKKQPAVSMPPPPQPNNTATPQLPAQAKQSQIIGSKGVPTKRMANQTSTSSGLSDSENENPVHENKRPLLSANKLTSTPTSLNGNIKEELGYQAPYTPKSLNSSKQSQSQVLQNSTNLAGKPKQVEKKQQQQPVSLVDVTPVLAKKKLKRECLLNTKTHNRVKLMDFDNGSQAWPDGCEKSGAYCLATNTNDRVYILTDLFAETANYLYKFNLMLELNNAQTQKISNINATNLNKKLTSLQDFLKCNTKTKVNTKSAFSLMLATLTERIEFVSNRLNDELIKLINYCMSNSSIHDSANAQSIKLNQTESINSIVSLASSQSKLISSNLNKPVSSLVVIDLLCLAFQICFDLFLFRVSYLLGDMESLKSSASAADKKNEKINLHKKLLSLKQDFFMLISTLLQSINFTSTTQSFKSLINPNQTISSTASSKQAMITSSSFSSYSTLKILITVLDCYNRILYLPNLNQVLEPDSITTCFYLSLVDNMHNMFKKFKILKLDKNAAPARVKKEEEIKMEEDIQIIEPKPEPIDQEMADVDDYSDADDDEKEERGENDDNDEDDEEDTCLFQLFYHKLIKYFGDVVYTLESNEYRLQNDESLSNQITNQENDPNNQIITTIAADDNITAASIDYKLEKTPFLPTSKSQTDLCNEFLHSQSSIDDEKKIKSELKSAEASNQANAPNSSLNTNSSNGVDAISSSCIQSLQVEFLTKFISYLHNMQFYASLETKLIAKSVNTKKKVNKNGPRKSTSTHGQKCMCYSNMLVSFLIMIDYKFNEKFINGARLDLNECYLTPFKSYTSYLFNQNLDLDETNASDVIKQFDSEPSSVATKAQLLLAKDKNEIEEKSNRFMYLLIMRYSHAFMSLFNDINFSNKQEQDEFAKQKIKLFESIKDDYRLKNFFCLFKLADSNYEDYIELLKLKSETEEGACGVRDLDAPDTTKTGLFNHLFTSLNTQKNLFKSYIENYFESSICSNLA